MSEFCRMTRILHLVAGNHRRGAETFAVELAEHHRGVGHDVRGVAVTDSGVAYTLPVEVAAAHRADPRGAARILAAARWSDVVVSFGSSSLSIGSFAARHTRRPFVYRQIGDPSVWGQVRWSNLRIGTPARSARTVVALYPGAADTLVRLYGLDRDSIRIIPRGVPEDRFHPATDAERTAALSQLGLNPDRRWVAYVGALSPEKDPLLAVDAVEHLADDVGLVIAGGGPLQGEVVERAAPLGPRVQVLGVIDDVRPVYSAADALVLPSLTEGIPGAALEASLCELPVVAFGVGGVPSVVLDQRTGRILDERTPTALAAGIGEALAQRSKWGPVARSHCLEHFSMRSVGQAWERMIDEATSSR